MTVEHLRFSTQILKRLGEELNPHPDQGILELIKNSYDADAKRCTVELINTEKRGGTIRISDDGTGMDLKDIQTGWLVVGSSLKSPSSRTAILGRQRAGNKGLGRLAALRLGSVATLVTRPMEHPDIELKLTIDWKEFERNSLVEEVPVQVDSVYRPPGIGSGTIIELRDVRKELTLSEVKRLARAMILLTDPFAGIGNFRAELLAPQFKELERAVKNQYFSEARYYLRAVLGSDGRASALVKDYNNAVIFSANHEDLCGDETRPRYQAPAATFELWVFLLGGKANFAPKDVSLGDLKAWLREFGGVHLYHRGLRVHPYSDYDWLDMNLRRAQSPELKPSTNTSIGRIIVEDSEYRLLQKTDRVGFVEDETFFDLRRFAVDALTWMADRRLKRREEFRAQKKKSVIEKLDEAKKRVAESLETLPAEFQTRVARAVESFQAAVVAETESLQEELQLYRTLCTVGATAATFAHQSKAPLAIITKLAKELEESVSAGGNPSFPSFIAEAARNIQSSSESLLAFAKVTLDLLNHKKRRRGETSFHDSMDQTKTMLEPFLKLRGVEVRLETEAERCSVYTSKAALETIFTNLIINSLEAFRVAGTNDRKIVFKTRNLEESRLEFIATDNGPGITGLGVDEIWLPGKTTTENGTGLGLTIVKDIVTELDGKVYALANGALGGAEFHLEIPVM